MQIVLLETSYYEAKVRPAEDKSEPGKRGWQL